jgi:hypothetical protein
VHPTVVEAYADGRLARAGKKQRVDVPLLTVEECLLLDIL